MNSLSYALAIGLLVFLGILAMAIALSGGLRASERRIRSLRKPQPKGRPWVAYIASLTSAFRQLGKVVPRSPEELGRVGRRLLQAGFRRTEGPYIFLGVQVTLVALAFAAFSASGHFGENPVLFGILSVLVGAALPDMWLAHAIRSRQDSIQLGLPDALDLQVVAVEAGLGLDQALMRVSEELRTAHPALCEELWLYNLEVNAGKSRNEALRNLGTRTDVPDLRALTAVLIQTDRFGTSIADSLRVFSDSLRTKRRQRAEEAAAKLPVKMVLPLFLFILPATIVVVLGPAIITIVKDLLPFMQGGQ